MSQNSTDGWPDWSQSSWYHSTDIDTLFNGILGEFDDIAIVPLNFKLHMVVLGSYIIAAAIFIFIGRQVGKEGFARSPWWALIVVRIIRGLMSISQHLTWEFLRLPLGGLGPFDFMSNTYFYDLGLYFIIIGQIRALYLALDLQKQGWYTFSRRLWGFLLFVMLTAGAYLSMCNFADLATNLPKIFSQLAITSHFLSGGAMIIFMVTSITILVASITTLVHYKSMEKYPGYGQWVQLIGIVVTFPLLVMRIIPDLLRTTIFHKPSLAEYIAVGVIPEWFILAIWFTLAVVVPRSYKILHAAEEEARTHCRGVWLAIFNIRIEELDPTSRFRALENMAAIQTIGEQYISIATFKSFYDNDDQIGVAETALFSVSWVLRVHPCFTMYNVDIERQVEKVKGLLHVEFQRRMGDDPTTAFLEEARIANLVIMCVHEGIGDWLKEKGHLPQSAIKAMRECEV